MATIHNLAKYVDHHTVLLVNGFIHEGERLLDASTFPDAIISFCIAFYYLRLLWDLEEEDNSTVLISRVDNWRTIKLNQSITNKMCKIFTFEVTVNRIKAEGQNHFFIGFIKNSLDTVDNIMHTHVDMSDGGNGKYTEAIKLQRNEVLLNGHANQIGTLPRYLEAGDKIKMIIDFEQDNCKWFWNDQDKALETISFNKQVHAITPAMSPYWKTSEYEITNYSFQY